MINLRLKTKIILLAVLAALVPVFVMSALTWEQRSTLQSTINHEVADLLRTNLDQIARDVYANCAAVNELVIQKVNHDLNVAREIMNNAGEVTLAKYETVAWDAINQYTKKETKIVIPKMLVGGEWLGQNRDPRRYTPVVDDTKRLVGGTCTIFQRFEGQGIKGILRVATNVEKLDGTRAIGTFIPDVNPDGTPNPVVQTVMRGDTFWGKAYVVNDWYITAYEPIYDEAGEIIGVLYVGVKQEAVESLRKAIMETKVGNTGYVWVIGAHGNEKGKYIISRNGERDGEDIWETTDENGNKPIQKIINIAENLKEGEVGHHAYLWKNQDDPHARMKRVSFLYFAPWGWVIGPNTYDDDFDEIYNKVDNALKNLVVWSLVVGIVILSLAVIVALTVGGRIANPISRITEVAQQIARGDLLSASGAVRSLGKEEGGEERKKRRPAADETGKLLEATRTMTNNLHSLVGQVQRSSIQLVSTATEIAATSKEQEATVNEFGATTNQIVSSTKEISDMSLKLVDTMGEVSDVVSDTAMLADGGHSRLGDMAAMMKQLAEASRSISTKLSVINEKANNINKVVTTITKVADQTNLLSLNAAIEAEKAGEYGRGFSVVASEIRRLADQTAVATLEIEEMVKEMQGAVSSGVTEMNQFTEKVRRGVEGVSDIGSQLEKIMEQVQILPGRFDDVTEGVEGQSNGARKISELMIHLNGAAMQMTASLREFNEATKQLNQAARNLQEEVSIFKVS